MNNYGELKAAVLAETLRDDLANEVAGFIRRAEGLIARRLRAVEMITVATLDEDDRVTTGEGLYTLPANFLEARAIWAPALNGGHRWLEQRSLSEIRVLPGNWLVQWYALTGQQVEFRGVPAEDTEILLEHFARPAAFSDDADTNTLLQRHEEVYLSGACFYLHRFAQDVTLAQGHLDSFEDSVRTLNEQAARHLGSPTVRPAYQFGSPGNEGY